MHMKGVLRAELRKVLDKFMDEPEAEGNPSFTLSFKLSGLPEGDGEGYGDFRIDQQLLRDAEIPVEKLTTLRDAFKLLAQSRNRRFDLQDVDVVRKKDDEGDPRSSDRGIPLYFIRPSVNGKGLRGLAEYMEVIPRIPKTDLEKLLALVEKKTA